jgi:hypothetical protein
VNSGCCDTAYACELRYALDASAEEGICIPAEPLAPLVLFRRVPWSCAALPGAFATVDGGARFVDAVPLDRPP